MRRSRPVIVSLMLGVPFLVPVLAMAPFAASAQTAPPADNADNAGNAASSVLTLADAITEALEANPDTVASQQQIAQASARLAQAKAQRRLQVQFTSTGSGSSVNVIQPPPSYQNFGTLQNGITVIIPTGVRPRLAGVQAREQFAVAQAQFQTARLGLVAQVTGAYFDLLRKQAVGEIARETRTQAERQLSEITKRFRAGDVPELDTLRAQVPVATAQSGEYQAESDLAVARQTLNSLLGRPLPSPLRLADSGIESLVATALPYTPDQAREKALAASPDIRAADAAVRAAQAALASARRFRDPAVSIQAIDTRSNDKTGFSRDDTIQASVTIPLSDGGLGRAQVKEAEAALVLAQAQTRIARRTVETSVAAAYLTWESRRRQIQSARVARDIAVITYEKTTKGYQAGLFSLSDLLNTQTVLTQARLAYTQALYDTALASRSLTATVEGASGPGIALPVPVPSPAGVTPSPVPVPVTPLTGGKPGGSSSHDKTPAGPGTATPATPATP